MNDVRVAVVGGGMAGLTAALRLSERGYKVTLYEERPFLGGQFSAHTHDADPDQPGARYHEHSYHMLLNWYHNFWRIVEDIGLNREWDFEPRIAVRHLAAGLFAKWLQYGQGGTGGGDGGPRMPALVNAGSPAYARRNLFSGIAPPPDMFLYAY
jgi:glycine/D-amino acid oxidase-like deaminating enzyme